jgi:CRP/FNR family cyclic AMP-dependent transcriptional regulator
MPAASDSPIAALLSKTAKSPALNEEELEFLTARVILRKFSEGELAFSEGEPCSGRYVVESGRIRIFKSSAGGREQVLSVDGPGESIAELPVFDGGAYPASAQAITPTTTVFLSKQDFQNLCRQHPEVALKGFRVVGERFAPLGWHPRGALVHYCAAPANNNELAAQIGTVRELVSRNLSRMQSEGLIQMGGRKATLPDLKKLEPELADVGQTSPRKSHPRCLVSGQE